VAYLEWLEKQLDAAVIRRRIGRPVALRAILQLTADHGLLAPLAGETLATASRWFEAPLSRLYAQGGAAAGYLSVMAEFAHGQSALVTAETTRLETPMVLVLLVGRRGTLRFDDAPDQLALEARDSPWRALIERSLGSGKPEAVTVP